MKSGASLIQYLTRREHGLLPSGPRATTYADIGTLIAEEKATLPTRNRACELSRQCRSTFLCSFSPDGKLVASTHGDHTVRVTEIKSGKCVHVLSGHPRTPWCVAFHPSTSDLLATGCLAGHVSIWDLRGGGREVWKNERGIVIASLSFHPTDQVLVIATCNELHFWDWSLPTPFAVCKTSHDYEKIRWVRFDPLGRFLYTGIANASTIQQEVDVENIDYISGQDAAGGVGASGTSEERQRLRRQYQNIVSEITAQQRRRAHQDLLDLDRPISPTRTESVEEARTFAAQVTQRANEVLHEARAYASEITRNAAAARRRLLGTSSTPPRPSSLDPRGGVSGGEEDAESNSNLDVLASAAAEAAGPRGSFSLTSASRSWLSTDNAAASSSTSSALRPPPPRREGSAFQSILHSRLALEGQTARNRRTAESSIISSTFLPTLARLRQDYTTPTSTSSSPLLSSNRTESPATSGIPSFLSTLAHFHPRSSLAPSQTSGVSRNPGSITSTSVSLSMAATSSSFGLLSFSSSNTPLTSVTASSSTGPRRLSTTAASLLRSRLNLPATTQPPASSSSSSASILTRNMHENCPDDCQICSRFLLPRPLRRRNAIRRRMNPLLVPQRSRGSQGVPQPVPPPPVPPPSVPVSSVFSSLFPLAPVPAPPVVPPVSTIPPLSPIPPALIPAPSASLATHPQAERVVQEIEAEVRTTLERVRSQQVNIQEALQDLDSLQMELNGMSSSTSAGVTRPTEAINVTAAAASNVEQPQPLSAPSPVAAAEVDPNNAEADIDMDLANNNPPEATNNNDNNMVDAYNPRGVPNVDPNTINRNLIAAAASSEEPDETSPLSPSPPPPQASTSGSSEGLIPSYLLPPNLPTVSSSSVTSLEDSSPWSWSRRSTRPRLWTTAANRRNLSFMSEPTNSTAAAASSSSASMTSVAATVTSSSIPAPMPSTLTPPFRRRRYLPDRSLDNVELEAVAARPEEQTDWSRLRAMSNLVMQADEEDEEPSIDLTSIDFPSNSDAIRLTDEIYPGPSLGAEDRTTARNVWADPPPTNSIPWRAPSRLTEASPPSSRRSTVDLFEELPSDDPRPLHSAIGLLSHELDSRIQQLDQRVNQIQQRLNERMAMFRQQHTDGVHSLARLRYRNMRLQSHLDDIGHRHGSRRNRQPATGTPPPPPLPPAAAAAAASGSPAATGSPSSARDRVRTSMRQRMREIRNRRTAMRAEAEQRRYEERSWHALQRRNLHPHYAVSILDDTINRTTQLQAAINRAIAGAFVAGGESNVGANINDLTHRIQRWDMGGYKLPDLTLADQNIVVQNCKLHNDATCDISVDGRFLSVLVPSHRGFPDDSILGVFSLDPQTLGQCMFTKSFGPNAVSVSISPLNNYLLVGLAARKYQHQGFSQKQMVAQVYKLKAKDAGEDSMEHICDLLHTSGGDGEGTTPQHHHHRGAYVSVNSARWLPGVGQGVVYGTNRGDLHICTPGCDERLSSSSPGGSSAESQTFRRNLMRVLGLNVPNTSSIATQTSQGVRRSASTQTDNHDEEVAGDA